MRFVVEDLSGGQIAHSSGNFSHFRVGKASQCMRMGISTGNLLTTPIMELHCGIFVCHF